ncbi:MAG TPA: hypothetical protein VF377_03525 [Acidimicrobiia bacterium]|jgi:hypothetical protein
MDDLRRTLDQVERDRLETYLGDGHIPWWYSLGFAVAGGCALMSMGIETRWLAIVVALTAAVTIGAMAGVAVRKAGAIPRLRTMPPPLRRVLIGYWVVAGVGIAAILVWAFTTETARPFVWAGGLYFVVVVLAGSVSDGMFRRRARRLADQAGIQDG